MPRMIRTSLDGLELVQHQTCIVGAGPAGLTLAMELARHRLPSLVLESGRRRPGPAQELSAAEIVDPRRHEDMRSVVARQFGGTSNLWGGRSVPFDAVDFEPRAFTGGVRWPITLADIAPYYSPACRYTNCGEPVFSFPLSVEAPRDRSFSYESIERASNKPRFQKAHNNVLKTSRLIDIRLGTTAVGLEIYDDGRATRILVVDADGVSRKIRADRFVVAAGGLETTRLLLTIQRQRPNLFGGPGGVLGRFYMGHIIGEIADLIFTDENFERAFDFLQDGNGSWVRRRFVPHRALQLHQNLPNICFWPVVPPVADHRHESGALSAVALALSTPVVGRLLAPEAIRTRHLGGPIDHIAHARNVIYDILGTSGFLTTFVRNRYLSRERIPGYFVRNRARRYGLSYHSEQSPRDNSRVSLSDAKDRFGMPRLRIDLRFHVDDAEAIARAHHAFADWFSRSGFGYVQFRHRPNELIDAIMARMRHGTHQIGTSRMGVSRSEAIVDRDLRTFDCRNLFVASSAVFPTSGQANPTLSIVAFAIRLAETIERDLKGAEI
jgi:GMC oxidoreductase/NAD(P)-binding Rossmann-like domain